MNKNIAFGLTFEEAKIVDLSTWSNEDLRCAMAAQLPDNTRGVVTGVTQERLNTFLQKHNCASDAEFRKMVDAAEVFTAWNNINDVKRSSPVNSDGAMANTSRFEFKGDYTVAHPREAKTIPDEVRERALNAFKNADRAKVYFKKLDGEARVQEVAKVIDSGAQVYAKGRAMVNEALDTSSIAQKVIQEVGQVVTFGGLKDGACPLKVISRTIPKDLKERYDMTTFSNAVVTTLTGAMPDLLKTLTSVDDLETALQKMDPVHLALFYHKIRYAIPDYAKGPKGMLMQNAQVLYVTPDKKSKRVENVSLLACDIIANITTLHKNPFKCIHMMAPTNYKSSRDTLVHSMFDGLPMKTHRDLINILHDLPKKLDYDVVVAETKNTLFCNYILAMVEAYKKKNGIPTKTLVVHLGNTNMLPADLEKCYDRGSNKVIANKVLGMHALDWKNMKLKYLLFYCNGPKSVANQDKIGDWYNLMVHEEEVRKKTMSQNFPDYAHYVIKCHIMNFWPQESCKDIVVYMNSTSYHGHVTIVSPEIDYSPRTKCTTFPAAQICSKMMELRYSSLWRKEGSPRYEIGGSTIQFIPNELELPDIKKRIESYEPIDMFAAAVEQDVKLASAQHQKEMEQEDNGGGLFGEVVAFIKSSDYDQAA